MLVKREGKERVNRRTMLPELKIKIGKGLKSFKECEKTCSNYLFQPCHINELVAYEARAG